MNIALCHDTVLPARGGCGTYITDLSRRLVADGHEVHLYARRWDATALPAAMHYHALPVPRGPRFLRPWRFGACCAEAVRHGGHQVSMGFDKTWGQDVLYPQGGLHVATTAYNLFKYPGPVTRCLAKLGRWIEPAHWSFRALERRQYLGTPRPLIIAISEMVRGHFQEYYGIASSEVRVVRCAIDPGRFTQPDRPRSRVEWRQRWGIRDDETVALFVAMNYRLKGLEPLLHAARRMPERPPFRLLIVGNRHTARYERLAQRLGIVNRLLFLGPRRDVHHCYFAGDFLVHPTFYDPCSLVVLEALACGLPVITSRHNGASELLKPPREGFVVEDPHDHEQLAWCMSQLSNPDVRAKCAQAARRTASEWTFEHHYRQLFQVLTEASARKRAA